MMLQAQEGQHTESSADLLFADTVLGFLHWWAKKLQRPLLNIYLPLKIA
jgi:hypothetical protein